MSRDDAISIKLNGGTGGIIALFPCTNFLEIYKTDATFQNRSPDDLDPKKINPNMQWTSTLTANIGTSNKIIARLILELDEFTKLIYASNDTTFFKIHDRFWKCKEYLLQCDKIALTVNRQIEKINNELSQNPPKNGGVIVLPAVNDLEGSSNTFLLKAKEYIQSLAEIFNILFGTGFHGPRFDKIRNHIETLFGKSDNLYKFVNESEANFLKPIVDWRNRLEHPKENDFVHIQNYSLSPDNTIVPPQWIVSGDNAYPIAPQMIAIVDGLLSFSEHFYIMCIQEKLHRLNSSVTLEIRHITPQEQDPSKPILYEPILHFPFLGI